MRHSASNSGPAARWIAPSTPPPPSSEVLAALTMASTSSVTILARIAFSAAISSPTRSGGRPFKHDHQAAGLGARVVERAGLETDEVAGVQHASIALDRGAFDDEEFLIVGMRVRLGDGTR